MPNRKGRRVPYTDWGTEDGLLQIEGWAREGLLDGEIAAKIGVSHSTFSAWKKQHPELKEALKRGQAPVDVKVEQALLKRALGYDYEEITTETRIAADGSRQQHLKKVTKHIPPDTGSMIYWLKNRKPDIWRDRREVSMTSMGQLSDLIAGLQEPVENDVHTEAETLDGVMENWAAETD